jgi:squalene synthase HpnC
VGLIYRFAREADDFADEGDAPPARRLDQLDDFRRQLAKLEAGEQPEIRWFADLGREIGRYRLPFQPFYDLLSAFSQDVVKARYASYAEVLDYCRRSANPVGRLMLGLFGAGGSGNVERSDAICSSLQLINFLQDVAIDYAKDRVYLPQDELARFGLADSDIARGTTSDAWRTFMAFQIERTRTLLYSGAPLARTLRGRIGLELRMTVAGGARILKKIEHVQGDVFARRPVLKPHDWLLTLARSIR